MNVLKTLALGLIRVYQYVVSPMLGPRCRFHPSCSHYMAEAITRHGLAAGGWLGLKRLAKCGPFHPGGVDPVPDTLQAPLADLVNRVRNRCHDHRPSTPRQ